MRGAVIGSACVHVVLLASLLIARGRVSMVVPGPDVVQVALVDLPASAAPQVVSPPPPKPDPKLAEIKPVEDTGVKLEKPKPPKAPVPDRETPPTNAPPAALPYAPVGSAGLRGQVAVDAGNFEFTYYLMLVRNQIAKNWTPPAGLGGGGVQATVYFRIGRGGDISSIRLETGSGREFFDRSALRAVQIAGPLPPLPLGYSGGDLGVHFGFEWTAP